MSKASAQRHAKFHSEVLRALTEVGGVIAEDDYATLTIHLKTMRIGLLVFKMFKPHRYSRPKDEVYSVYSQLSSPRSNEDLAAAVAKVNAVFRDCDHDTMSHSAKWNLHSNNAQGIVDELRYHRLPWLMQEG